MGRSLFDYCRNQKVFLLLKLDLFSKNMKNIKNMLRISHFRYFLAWNKTKNSLTFFLNNLLAFSLSS